MKFTFDDREKNSGNDALLLDLSLIFAAAKELKGLNIRLAPT